MFFFTTTHYNNLQSLLRLHALAFFFIHNLFFFLLQNSFFSVLFIYFLLSIIYFFFSSSSCNQSIERMALQAVLVIGLVLVVLGVKQNEWHLGFITTQYYAYMYVRMYDWNRSEITVLRFTYSRSMPPLPNERRRLQDDLKYRTTYTPLKTAPGEAKAGMNPNSNHTCE